MKVGIIGASGYVGGEVIRILSSHEKVDVVCATSRNFSGEYVFRVHPNLRGTTELKFSDPQPDQIISQCDIIISTVPHGESVKILPQFVESGIKIIDLSADFRLRNSEDYEKWYGYQHPHPDLLEKFVYGVPELHRSSLKNAQLVACPGCMAVTSILALSPFVKNALIDRDRIVVDSKIGSSGGGVKPSLGTHHAERYGVVRPYKPVGHRHTAEIEQELGILADNKVTISMSPHAVNIVRGILCTIHVFPKKNMSVSEVWKTLRGFYKNEPFIRFIRDYKGLYRYPDPKILVGSNFCDIGFEIDEHANRLVLLSATDNLVKGAAGSAVQCLNVISGFDEKTGLRDPGLHPA